MSPGQDAEARWVRNGIDTTRECLHNVVGLVERGDGHTADVHRLLVHATVTGHAAIPVIGGAVPAGEQEREGSDDLGLVHIFQGRGVTMLATPKQATASTRWKGRESPVLRVGEWGDHARQGNSERRRPPSSGSASRGRGLHWGPQHALCIRGGPQGDPQAGASGGHEHVVAAHVHAVDVVLNVRIVRAGKQAQWKNGPPLATVEGESKGQQAAVGRQ